MTSSAAIAARPMRRYDGLAFHALVVGFIIATQVIYTPARDLGPDNTWHYRFARDIVTGVPVFWAGLDGNRLFPDLIFAVLAYVLSGGALFAGWLPYFYALFFLALYASLLALAVTLYEEVRERRAFLLLAVAGLWIFELAAPFWPRWFFDPGNHGTGLPVAFGCLALAFWMNARRRFSAAAALGFVLAASLLVGSNRFLLIGFLVPLLAALIIALATRWVATRGNRRDASSASGPLLPLIVMVGVAGLGSFLGYRLLSDLSWHKGTTYMGVQLLNHDLSIDWAMQKLGREITDLAGYFSSMTKQVVVGPLLILATVPASLILLGRALRRQHLSGHEENRLILGLFTACSALLSIAFVIWGWEENGEWRYRYLAMATAFAVVFLVKFLVPHAIALARPGLMAVAALLGLTALTLVPAFHREAYAKAERNQKFLREIDELKGWLVQQGAATPPRGFGEYWAVMDISARTGLGVDLVDGNSRAQFYNNNAGSLCAGGYSFILRKVQPDAPKRSEIVALLGEPRASKEFELEGHQGVEILVYDPDMIQSRIVEPGKQAATRLFPRFSCSR